MTTLIGTNPDQVPVNSMLGGMAYQDPDSINVKDLNSSGTANIASLVSPAASITNLSYSGTLTGGTGVINIGSGQIYKDASGNVGIGVTPSGGYRLDVNGATRSTSDGSAVGTYTGGALRFTQSTDTYIDYSSGGTTGNLILRGGTSFTERLRVTPTGDIINSGTGATKLQEGTTAQRPASPQEGMIRKNSTLGVIEGYSGGGYVSLEAGRLVARTVYSSPGSFTWTPNAKTKHAVLILISGGGGSGGCPPTNASQGAMSTPGANGQFVRCEIPRDSTFGASYSVVVGAAGVFGVRGASPTNGTAGGSSSVTNNTSAAVISITGGDHGAAGFATSTFPVIQTNLGPSSITNTGAHFVVWERAVVTITQAMLFNITGSIWYDMKPLIAGMGSSVAKGGGGYPGVCINSNPSGVDGQSGSAGEVIIYEYS